jgi:regulator of cell morphogenesis and NO signaling
MQAIKDFNGTISEIVRADYRTADVFRKYGINYCCGGNILLDEVCNRQNVDINSLQNELNSVVKKINIPASLRFDEWTVDFMIDYIINVHHAYLRQSLPLIKDLMTTFVKGHRNQYPYLDIVLETYLELSSFLLDHLQEEEEKVFPYIKHMSHTYKHNETYGRLFVKNWNKPLKQVLQSDHQHVSALLLQLRKESNQYTFGEDACTNHLVIYQKLQELDDDIVQHQHLENNILFPKAILMEKELLQL